VSVTSSDSASVSATAIGGTLPTSFSVEVQTLAKAKATASAALPTGAAVGGGTLSLKIGSGTPVSIAVSATDTVSDIASSINGAGAGVTASVLTDATGDRLLLRSSATGLAAAFTLAVTAETGVTTPTTELTDKVGLSRLVAGTATESTVVTQVASDAAATVNGIAVTSTSNTFTNTISGVTFNALKQTSGPVEVTVTKDTSAVSSNIDAFVKAYNDVNQLLQDATKYDATTKAAGLLQGDTTAVTLQNSLRNAIQSVTSGSSKYTRLADVGITQQRGGDLLVDSAKLTSAFANMDELKKLFSATGTGSANGIAVQIKGLATNLLSTDGFFSSKDYSLQIALKRNAQDQAKVNDRATRLETSLNARYSALDVKMASLNALNAYVAQQVTTWNKNTA
jgi:flagellar hook-associated protein 2